MMHTDHQRQQLKSLIFSIDFGEYSVFIVTFELLSFQTRR